MKREHVSRMVAKRAATPGAANNSLGILRILVRYAIDIGLRPDDPTFRGSSACPAASTTAGRMTRSRHSRPAGR